MNLIMMAFVALILISVLLGYHRGLLKSALGTIGIIGAILLANLLNPYVKDFLCEHTGISDIVRQRIETGLNTDQLKEYNTVYGKEEYLEKTDLPELVKNYIRSSEAVANGQKTLDSYVQNIVSYLTDMVMSGIAYLATLLIVVVLLIVFMIASRWIKDIPIVGGIDKAGGIIFGLARAVIIMWIAMVLATFFSVFGWGKEIMGMIEDSAVLTFVYKKNIFMKIIVDILGNI